MRWLHSLTGSFYTLFFILLNLLYLTVELSFNARILDASAAFSPTTDYGQLELYGRSISAAGATLFAWRIFISPRSQAGFFKLWMRFLLIALLVFPLVFVGQKRLVDSLVNLSSADTRRSAEILSLLKYGVANGFVEIEALSTDELLLETAEGKMFITLSGLLAYQSSHMRAILERELDKITRYAVQTQQQDVSHRLYRAYLFASQKILQQYQRYQHRVDELEQRQAESTEEAIELYQQAMNAALEKWQVYQQRLAQNPGIDEIAETSIAAVQYLLLTVQQRLNRCASESCRIGAGQQAESRLAGQLGFYSPVSQWCVQSQKVEITGFSCLKQADLIEMKIRELRYLSVALKAGLSRVYTDRLGYLTSAGFRSTVFLFLQQQGIEPRSDWQFDQYSVLLAGIRSQLDQRFRQQYDAQIIDQFSASLPPRSDLQRFVSIEQMQSVLARALGEFYRHPVAIGLSYEAFDQRFLAPVFDARRRALLNRLQADTGWYQDGAPSEASGKASLRNLVIPAVAIAFSLVFGLLNAINLILNLVFLMIEEKPWLRWSLFSLMLALVLLMPMRHDYRIYSQPAYIDLLSETRQQYGGWADVLDWVAKTEPLIYPLGNILRYNVLNGFSFD